MDREGNKNTASEDEVIPNALDDTAIAVGSPAWFKWLATAESFAFTGESSTFTARKEHTQRGKAYWRAYCMRHGVLRRAYLGKSENLTQERLNQAAHDLARAEQTQRAQQVQANLPPKPSVSTSSPLMTNKSFIPALPTLFIHRPRLNSLFQQQQTGTSNDRDCFTAEQPHIYVVTAPAGFGKTTLLRCWAHEWMQAPQHNVAWVSLAAGDTEPALFWRYIAIALDKACPGVGEAALAQLESRGEGSFFNVVAALANGIATAPLHLLLVLDDYHVISTPIIHETLKFFMGRLPTNTCIVLSSRTRLPLALARLTMQGQVSTLTADELRFTGEEMTEFFARASAVPLSAEVFATLNTVIAGWAAGLQLASMALRMATHTHASRVDHTAALQTAVQSFVQGKSEVMSTYLLEEVLSQQPPSLQEVLLRTGCLDSICPSLFAAVADTCVGTPGAHTEKNAEDPDARKRLDEGRTILNQLAHDQLLLTPLNELDIPHRFIVHSLEPHLSPQFHEAHYQRKQQMGRGNPAMLDVWYRYHPLLAEFLRDRLRRTNPTLFLEVQRRAAVWHAQHGFIRTAIAYALAAADIPYAIQLIEDHAEATYQRGDLVTLRQWLEALPAERVNRRPFLCLLHAKILTIAGDFAAAEARLEEAAQVLSWSHMELPAVYKHPRCQERREHQKGPDEPTRILTARILAAQAEVFYHRCEHERSLEVIRQALRLLPKDEQEHRLEMLSTLAEALVGTRQLADCIATSEQVVALSRARGYLPRLIMALYDLGYYRHLQGRLPAAADCFSEALLLAQEREDELPRPMGLIHMGMGHVLYEWNNLTAARIHLLRALELNTLGSSAGLNMRCHTSLAFICEAQGNLAAARAHLERVADYHEMTLYLREFRWAGESNAQFWLRHGETAAASAWVQEMGVTAETEARPEVDDALLVLARLLLATGKAKESLVILQRVRAGPEKQKYINEVIPIIVVQAKAYQAMGAASEAVTTLAGALALAESGGYVRIFLDEGPMLLPLLRAIGRSIAKRAHSDAAEMQWPSAVYVQHVAGQYRVQDVARVITTDTDASVPGLSRLNSLFTVREWEIIEYLLAGRSNYDIAQALVVKQSTLKWHLGHIYAKLNARNLADALVRLQKHIGANQPYTKAGLPG